MGKLKSILIVCLAACCPFLAGSDTTAGEYLRTAAFISAGAIPNSQIPDNPDTSNSQNTGGNTGEEGGGDFPFSDNSDNSDNSQPSGSTAISDNPDNQNNPDNQDNPKDERGTVITLNRSDYRDTADYSQYTEHSGEIVRYNFGKYTTGGYLSLSSGAQVRNCTEVANSVLESAAAQLPSLDISTDEPVVLIYHTHTSESFLPQADWYDKNYPLRSSDPDKSIVAVGDAICEALAKRGISSVHDCTVHDDPYTGSYYRSEETVLRALREYPGIRLVIDVHRDGISASDGSLAAPVAMIEGKSAAQFMLISCCESDWFDMPDYIENFKLACLIQNCAEERYPTLARPILFDYRNYNQNLSTGALLLEVGSHGNSLEEAVYTGELMGNVLADAIKEIEGG